MHPPRLCLRTFREWSVKISFLSVFWVYILNSDLIQAPICLWHTFLLFYSEFLWNWSRRTGFLYQQNLPWMHVGGYFCMWEDIQRLKSSWMLNTAGLIIWAIELITENIFTDIIRYKTKQNTNERWFLKFCIRFLQVSQMYQFWHIFVTLNSIYHSLPY
jgi:hypothetical protein